MGLHLSNVGLKFLSAWVVLLLVGLSFGPTPGPGKAAVMAAVVAVVAWLADLAMPFQVQGITRWAIDSGLAFVALYLAQFLWPGTGINFYTALFAGFVIGAIEVPLHFWLAARFGVLRREKDGWDGIR